MTLLAIDSASLWYRAYYGMPDTLTSPSGEPVNAIRGFIDMTARLITHYRPDRVLLCLDGDWRPSWRVELFPAYKENRIDAEGEEEEPDLLSPQVPIILDFFDAFGLPIIGVDDYEADDVLATIATTQPGPIRIATGDRDLFQLVDDDRDVKVAYLAKGISSHELVDRNWIAKKYEIPGDRYGLFAMIRGDASDGLPGIRGIGEKGAALIANQFADMSDVISAAESGDAKLPANLAKKLLADIGYAKIATELVSCARDIRLPEVDLQLPKSPSDSKELEQITKEYGLGTSLGRLKAALNWS
jgi:5'-3' exonuclease